MPLLLLRLSWLLPRLSAYPVPPAPPLLFQRYITNIFRASLCLWCKVEDFSFFRYIHRHSAVVAQPVLVFPNSLEFSSQPVHSFVEFPLLEMENILKVFLMAFPEWLACIFMVVGLVVTALAAVRLGYGLVVAKTVYKWIVNAEEKFGSGAGAEKKAHVIAVLRGYTPDWLDWAINERTLDWIVQLVFDFTKKKLEDYMAKKSAETTTVAHFGNVGENKRND